MNNKMLLILERSSSNLKVDKESGDFVLEGIFAQFGVENNNKRIYEEKEYLPHLEYLKQKISENRLMGELDHPDKFEVSLNKVSHIIESLEYDKGKRQIKGRIRLLDTPSGKIAKSLVQSGVPISISSRAAGSVGENKKVNIKKIFTYDLVCDPGFDNAQLSQINESFGLALDDNIQIFDASPLGNFEAPKKYKKESIIMENNEYVSIESMNDYSISLKREIEALNRKVGKMQESVKQAENSDVKQLSEKLDMLIKYSDSLGNEISENRKYANYLSGKLNETIGYTEGELAQKLDELVNYTESEVGNRVDQIINYVNEEVAPHVEKIIEHNNYIVENLNSTIGYVENEVGGKLDETIQYSEYLSDEINKNRSYSEYLSENAVENNDFKDLVDYTEYIYENSTGGSFKSARQKTSSEKATEAKTKSINERYRDIDEKINNVFNEVKKEKQRETIEKSRYSFVNMLTENNQQTFETLNHSEKERVKDRITNGKNWDVKNINTVFTNALNETHHSFNAEPNWLTDAPEKYQRLYETLSTEQKEKVHAQAKWYDGKLKTQYQINNFWQTRGLNETQIETQTLNESYTEQQRKESINLGYTNNRVDAIRKALGRFDK